MIAMKAVKEINKELTADCKADHKVFKMKSMALGY